MHWRWRYHLSLYFRNSLWILPALSIVLALATVSLLTRYEQSVGSYATVSIESVRVIMSTVAGATFTLVVLVSSAVLVVIQLASAQLTPRLRAMLTDLIKTLPPRRAGILEQELRLLATSSKRNFQDPADVQLAEAGDLQGIGGSYDVLED